MWVAQQKKEQKRQWREAGIEGLRSSHYSLIVYQKILGRYGSTTYSPDLEKLGIYTSPTRQAESQVSNLGSSDLGTEWKLSML